MKQITVWKYKCTFPDIKLIILVQGLAIDVIVFFISRVDTDVLMEVAYSCKFLAVSDSSTCPDIGTSWCHAGIIEHFDIRGFKLPHRVIMGSKIKSA